MKFKHQHRMGRGMGNRMGKRGSGGMKPAGLFADSDRDGVPNVFDCQPHNKRKQDVRAPMSGGSPMAEMHYRHEAARQQAAYLKQLAEWQKQQEQQSQNPTVIYNTEYIDRTVYYPTGPSSSSSSGSKKTTQVGMGYGGGSNTMNYSGTGSKQGGVSVNVVAPKKTTSSGFTSTSIMGSKISSVVPAKSTSSSSSSKVTTVSAPKSSSSSVLSSMGKSVSSAISKGISGLGGRK
jgi:hypothetical protein